MTGRVDFWFEFASTYTYLSMMRIEGEAAKRGVELRWRPFLLGPIFAAQGWSSSPFNVYPAKGAYMWRDMERRAAALGAPFERPSGEALARFPQNGLLAARTALIGIDEGWGAAFCRAVCSAEWVEARDISDQGVVADAVEKAGGDPGAALARATTDENKMRLRANCEEAQRLGLFGAPSFTVGGELFWGDDRLEAALDWAAQAAPS